MTIHEPCVGKKSTVLVSFTFKCSSYFPSLPTTMIGCSSSLRDSDSIIYFSTVQLQYHGSVHDASLGKDSDEKYCLQHLGPSHRDLLHSKRTPQFWSILEICFPNFKYSSQAWGLTQSFLHMRISCHKIKYSCMMYIGLCKRKKKDKKKDVLDSEGIRHFKNRSSATDLKGF